MLPYYGLLTLSVIMFGVNFFLNDRYQKKYGNGAVAALVFAFAGSITGALSLMFIAKFDFCATPFTLIWATVTALNNIAFCLCSLKALERVNLSLFSLFSMLGGMMLPFLAGIIFYGETMTLGKGICVVLICAALAITVKPTEKSRGGEIYYILVFILNGMCGVLTKIYEDSALPKVSAEGYSLWTAIVSILLTGAALIVLGGDKKKPEVGAVLLGAGGGVLERVANLFLLIALTALPASVQYPFVTGGVMISATVIAAIAGQKPSRRELTALCISFIGLIALVVIPI